MKNRIHPIFVSLIVISTAGLAQAASLEWKGLATGLTGGTDATWNTDTTANWWDGAATVTWPALGGIDDDAIFAGTAGTVTIAGGVTANDLSFTTAGYTISGATLTLNGTAPLITNAFTAEIASIVAGTALINKAGGGTLTLSANNTFTGGVTSTGGVIKITNSNALGAGSKTFTARSNFARLDLDASGADINLASGIVLNTSGVALRNIAGNNTIAGRVDMGNGSGDTTIGSNGGTLTLTGLMRSSNSGNRALILTGTSTTPNTVAGVIQNNASTISLTKSGTGKWIVSGTNTYTGTTSVTGGNLTVTNASGLGAGANVAGTNPTGGNVSVSTNAELNYAAKTDAALAIGGSLTITGGTSTAIGGSIGATTTSARINVAGVASITNAAHSVNIHRVPGTTLTSGTYTLISGGAGSSLNPATAPTIGKIYNNTDFTVGALSRTATTLSVDITTTAPMATAYWAGNLAGSTNVWAVSNGSASNWKATAGAASSQALIPGSSSDVVISATTPDLSPAATILGSDMSIKSLTISDTVNGLGLNADGNTLTLASGGITMDSTVPASTIAAKVALDAPQTWTNNSLNDLTVSGAVSGANALTKAGSGTLVLSSANTYSGDTRVAAGTLALANLNAIATSTLDMNASDTGTVTFTVAGSNTYNLGGLSGSRSLNAGSNTLSVGARNVATEYSGNLGSGSLTKVGNNTLTLSGSSTFTGNIVVGAGRITLANSNALGIPDPNPPFNGRKGLVMQGSGRSIWLKDGITIPSTIDIFASSNSFDGGGINNESGNNQILGPVNISTGNPALNISSASGSLSIAGNITLTATSRPLHLGGASTGDNIISGVIGSNNFEILPVIKQGTGKWILSNTNTYTGTTTILDGTLLVNGSTAAESAVAVNGGTLGGSGTVNGPVTVAAAATLAPGVALGTLNLGTTALNGTLTCDVDGANNDVLAINGDLNIGATAVLSVNVINPATSGAHVIATYTGSRTGTLGGTLPPGYSLNYNDAGKSIELIAPVTSTPFQDWMSSNFPSVLPNTAEADPDNDGVNNLAEFAFSGNPGDGANNGLKRTAIDNISGTDYLTYTFACRTGAIFTLTSPALASQDGVDYGVRASTDLNAFTFGVDEVSPAITTGLPAAPTGYGYRTFRVTAPRTSQSKAFIQVKTSPTP